MWLAVTVNALCIVLGAMIYHVVKMINRRYKAQTLFFFHKILIKAYFPNALKNPGSGMALLTDVYEALVGFSMLENLEEGRTDLENFSLALEILLEKN